MPPGQSAYHNRNGATVAERLANRSVRDGNGCLLWTGATLPFGHGTLQYNNIKAKAHRVAWELARGPIPPGMVVCHKCDVPSCINVDHLFLGTQADNVADMMRKGRYARNCGETNGRAKLTADQIAEIVSDPRPQIAIAKDYGVKQPQVSRIKRGQTWLQRRPPSPRGLTIAEHIAKEEE